MERMGYMVGILSDLLRHLGGGSEQNHYYPRIPGDLKEASMTSLFQVFQA